MTIHDTPESVASTMHSSRLRSRLSLLSLVAGFSAFACGGRYDLGQTRTSLLDEPLADASQIGVLIIDGPEDADAATSLGVAKGIGDIDGDGYGDLLAERNDSTAHTGYLVVYGGPRTGGEFRGAAEGARMGPRVDGDLGIVIGADLTSGGDVNGDGSNDLLISGIRYDEYSFNDASERFTHSDEEWARHQTRLIYGDSARPGGDLLANGAHLNPYPRVFPRELAESLAEDFVGYEAQQYMHSRALRDIDGDGYDDLALRVWFELNGYIVTRDEYGSYRENTNIVRDVSTYVFYGGPRRFEADAAANLPSARLSNVSALDPVGDVDGDGLIDFIVTWGAPSDVANTLALVPGRAGRIAGESSLEEGLIIEGLQGGGRSVGDLDGDGYGDFVISGADDTGKLAIYLFYGAPGLTREPLRPEFADASFEDFAAVFVESAESSTRLELIPVGDWTGDGLSDLLLTFHASTFEQHGDLLVPTGTTGEARIIPGSGERYSGRYAPPGIGRRADGTTAGSFVPLGDVDGDGLTDLAFWVGTQDGNHRQYIKYGGPLAADVR